MPPYVLEVIVLWLVVAMVLTVFCLGEALAASFKFLVFALATLAVLDAIGWVSLTISEVNSARR